MASDKNTSELVKPVPPRALWRRILLPRFSLRTMLVLVTLFSFAAAWVGNWIYRSEQQKQTIVALESLDATVLRSNKRNQLYGGIIYDDPKLKSWVPRAIIDYLGDDYFYPIDTVAVQSNALVNPEQILKTIRQIPKFNKFVVGRETTDRISVKA